MGDSTLPWTEKYRPTTLTGIQGHSYILESIRRFIAQHQLPHLLLYGPPGTGKTTTALAVCREVCGKHYNTLLMELNASDERGIDVVRDQIKACASTRPLIPGMTKFIVLDESDRMTTDAQNAMKRIIEKYSGNVRFIFICNEVGRIIMPIQSRCARFRFGPLERDDQLRIIRNVAARRLTRRSRCTRTL